MNIDISTVPTPDLVRALARTAVPERPGIPLRHNRRRVHEAVNEAKGRSTADLINSVQFTLEATDDIRVFNALIFRELRDRVERGDEGEGVKWYEWARKNLKRGKSRLRELQRIANAKDPWQELERLRGLGGGRKKRMDVKKKNDYETGLREMIRDFARNARYIYELKSVVDHIARLPTKMC